LIKRALKSAAAKLGLLPAKASLPRAYFEALFAQDPDPWGFRTSDYEKAKYADTVAALDGRVFDNAVEIGCANGELTNALAGSCRALLGLDISETALDLARARNTANPQVRFERMTVPQDIPAGRFDLIVLSEVLYYLGPDDLKRFAAWVGQALTPDGVVLMVTWLGETPGYPMTGAETIAAFFKATAGQLLVEETWPRERYRMDRLTRRE
jgi:predicted TPR repeat methyltransferase